MVSSVYSPVRVFSTASPDPCDARRDGAGSGDGVAAFTPQSPPCRMIRDGNPACRLNPASPAVPAASAKEENKKNNNDKRLGIHDVKPFQYDGFGLGLGLSTISAFARMPSPRPSSPCRWTVSNPLCLGNSLARRSSS